MADAQLRLFVACELPAEVLNALSQVQDDLQRAGAEQLRWVRPEGIHLTLKFLGEIEAALVDGVVASLSAAIQPFAFRVRPDRLGGFGGRRLRVVWVGLDGQTEELSDLAKTVERALEPLGFPPERRPFASHLTLARVRERASAAERERLSSLVGSYQLPPLPEFSLSRAALIQSMLGPGGATYRTISRFPGRSS